MGYARTSMERDMTGTDVPGQAWLDKPGDKRIISIGVVNQSGGSVLVYGSLFYYIPDLPRSIAALRIAH